MLAILFNALILTSSLDGSSEVDRLLENLQRDLSDARLSTPEKPIVCPENVQTLSGTPLEEATSYLGDADVVDHGTNENHIDVSVHQYLFADSRTTWLGLAPAAGLGTAVTFPEQPFTVLRIEYSSAQRVQAISCYVAGGA